MASKAILVDMDQTLIESVLESDPRYSKCTGTEIVYYNDIILNNGTSVGVASKVKVNIRPYACHMIGTLVSSGHRYILWSAGMKNYVHAVMKYFSRVCGVEPFKIYTREDLVHLKVNEASVTGNHYKSMMALGYLHDEILIIEDNPNLVAPEERDQVIQVIPWVYENKDDRELSWVAQLLLLYGKCKVSIITDRQIEPFNAYSTSGYIYNLSQDLGQYDLTPSKNRVAFGPNGKPFVIRTDYDNPVALRA